MSKAQVERYHKKRHSSTNPIENCFQCTRALGICKGKVTYSTWQEAQEAADHLITNVYGWGDPVVRYRCTWCDSWHLTKPKTKYRLRKVEKARRKALWRAYLSEQEAMKRVVHS